MKLIIDDSTTPASLLAELASAGAMEFCRADCRTMDFDKKSRDQHARDANKIGEYTFKREGKHNEILKALKSDDIQNIRHPDEWKGSGRYFSLGKQEWVSDPNFRATRKRSGVVSLPHEKV